LNVFVSYAFNEGNLWIEELAIPLIRALGFGVVTGRRMEGEIIVDSINERMAQCRGGAPAYRRTKLDEVLRGAWG
jgi:hypothetical protein